MMNPFLDISISLFPNIKVPKEATLIKPLERAEWLDLESKNLDLCLHYSQQAWNDFIYIQIKGENEYFECI